jgi:hypothetical protein
MFSGGIVLPIDQKSDGEIKLGQGFTRIPYKPLFSGSYFSDMPDGCLDLLMTMAAHHNRVSGTCHSSKSRLLILAGIGPDSFTISQQWLEKMGWIELLDPNENEFKLHFLDDEGEWFPLFQNVIFRGIWSVLSPSAKKLFIIFLRNSEAFKDDLEYIQQDHYGDILASASSDSGRQMVLGNKINIELFSKIASIKPRTFSKSFDDLIQSELVESDDFYYRIIINNVPELIYPSVMKRLMRARRDDQRVKPGVKASLAKHANRSRPRASRR